MLTASIAPYGLDVSSKGDIALAANMGGGRTGDNDTVSIIDLKGNAPRVVNTVSVAASPEGIKISPDGQYVAVSSQNGTNRPKSSPFHDGGILAVFQIRGTELQKVAETPVGRWCQGIVWSAKSNRILVQCMVEQEIQVFNLSGRGTKKLDQQPSIKVSGGPAGIRTIRKTAQKNNQPASRRLSNSRALRGGSHFGPLNFGQEMPRRRIGRTANGRHFVRVNFCARRPVPTWRCRGCHYCRSPCCGPI